MKKLIFVTTLVSLLIWILNFFSINATNKYLPQTVFKTDYQGRQLILRNINLYPNIFLARFFQNKVVLVSDKYLDNLFDFLDPNYYFFGSHPREVADGQNYVRLPLTTLILIVWYFFSLNSKKRKNLIYIYGTISLLLSFFTNHYLYDFLLWPLFIYVIYHGLLFLHDKNRSWGYMLLFLLLLESAYELRHFYL